VIFVVRKRIMYGPIYHDEKSVKFIHNISENDSDSDDVQGHSLFDLLMPLSVLIGGVFIGILYAGNFYLFGGANSLFTALRQNNQTFLVLCVAGFAAFAMSFVWALYKKRIVITQLPKIMWDGFLLMQTPIIMVILAAILGGFLRIDLHTGSYIASLLLGRASLSFIPVILFVTSLVITITTGSAWGTFSLLIPITTEMLIALLQLSTPISFDSIAIFLPTLAALLSGAACGDHISPFSETTVMTAASTKIDPLVHARTQFYYALPVICGTIVAFMSAGMMVASHAVWLNILISCGLGCGISMLLLIIANRLGR